MLDNYEAYDALDLSDEDQKKEWKGDGLNRLTS